MKLLFNNQDFNSTKWFTLEKIVQLVVAIVIIPKIFNVLGAADIGKLKYVESIVGMLSPLFFLGLSAVCIREIVYYPKRTPFILATAFGLRLISWTIIILCILIYLTLFKEIDLFWLYVIIAFSYLFRLTNVFEYYLIAVKWSKIIFITKISTLIIIVLLQYYGVKNQLDVFYFAYIFTLDFLLQGLLYIFLLSFKKKLHFRKWKFSKIMAKHLLKLSFPLIISNLLISFYITIDEIFLRYYHDDKAIGIFATVQFLVIFLSWNIGFSIINTLYPSLAKSYQNNKKEYALKTMQLFKIMALFGVLIGITYTLFGDYILDYFYSNEFTIAKFPLKIFCWAPLFVFVGMLYEKHLLNSDQLQKNVYRFILGCIVNIILCYMLIPTWNVIGAAIAVLTSHFITNIGYIILDKSSRIQLINFLKLI